MDSNILVLVFIFQTLFISRSLATHRLPPFDRYRLIFLEIGVDFYISATDFLEIEIYYNKKKFFELFSLKKELSMGGLLHFRYRLPRDWNLLI